MRPVAIVLGLLALGAAWLGPLPVHAHASFLAHMSMHVAVVSVASPLLALGVAGGRLDPTRRAPWLFGPIAASLLEFVVVWSWHLPRLHAAATGSPAMLAVEQTSFLAVGTILWLSCFGAGRRTTADSATAVFALFLTSMHMTLLGALLALAQRPLYAHGGSDGAFGLTAVQDQQLGGVAMLLVGGASYLAGGLYLTARLLGHGARARAAADGTESHASVD